MGEHMIPPEKPDKRRHLCSVTMTATAGVLSVLLLALQITGQTLPHKEVPGPPNSPIKLRTDIKDAGEYIWKCTNNGTTKLIAKYQNGNVVYISDGYNLTSNGRVLVINSLTKNDNVNCTAEGTLSKGILANQTFNVTVQEEVKNDQSADDNRILTIVLSVLAVVVVVGGVGMAVLWWKCWKRSSKTSENTSYSDVDSSDGLDREDHCSVFFSGGGGNDPAYCRV